MLGCQQFLSRPGLFLFVVTLSDSLYKVEEMLGWDELQPSLAIIELSNAIGLLLVLLLAVHNNNYYKRDLYYSSKIGDVNVWILQRVHGCIEVAMFPSLGVYGT